MKKLLSILVSLLLVFSFCSCTDNTLSADPSMMEVHFLDVGQADSTLVLCGDEALLIDGGNNADSSFIYSYLRDHNVDNLEYIIATHPHEDHIGGLMGALSYTNADIVYSCTDNSNNSYFVRLNEKLKERGIPLVVPEIGTELNLGKAKVTFLGPARYTNDENDNSLCFRIDYGDISFLFTGDASYSAEKRLIENKANLSSTVLHVGHHGSGSSSCYEFLREVNMDYAVISVEKNSGYGHPDEGTLSRLLDAGADVYRTDEHGTVIFKTDGKSMIITPEKDAPVSHAHETAADPENCMYIGNLKSEKYHRKECRSLPNEENRVYFATLEDAIKSGFSPCGNCKP